MNIMSQITSTISNNVPLTLATLATGAAAISMAAGMLTPVGLITGLISLHLVGLSFAIHHLNSTTHQQL